ncbi:MAG: RNA pseudouridine synthase [Spirochaetaceae bacterium]|jgi:23S rRNA pseudouridine1911/1915/1917 synthase|nr:RNA pseudouridine synthase [Spirochaetaceae bacterium]
MYKSCVLDETSDYAVVYKPPRMHGAPLRNGESGTLLNWYALLFPPVLTILGRRPQEGGLLHRLDYATHGLVLFAKTQSAMDILQTQQEGGLFVKEYGALSMGNTAGLKLSGFPPIDTVNPADNAIESAFRAYGQGRKAVRPVIFPGNREKPGKKKNIALDRGYPYKTEIPERIALEGGLYFSLRIVRGFRHQIRCHLSWIGCPIVNDRLYGGVSMEWPAGVPAGEESPPGDPALGGGDLALRAQGLFFYDPASREPRSYTIPSIKDTPLLSFA